MVLNGVPKQYKRLKNCLVLGIIQLVQCVHLLIIHIVYFFETNIRTVLIHHFFEGQDKVSDQELLPYLEALADKKKSRFWYTALMDYGAYLKTVQKVLDIERVQCIKNSHL